MQDGLDMGEGLPDIDGRTLKTVAGPDPLCDNGPRRPSNNNSITLDESYDVQEYKSAIENKDFLKD